MFYHPKRKICPFVPQKGLLVNFWCISIFLMIGLTSRLIPHFQCVVYRRSPLWRRAMQCCRRRSSCFLALDFVFVSGWGIPMDQIRNFGDFKDIYRIFENLQIKNKIRDVQNLLMDFHGFCDFDDGDDLRELRLEREVAALQVRR